MEEVEEERANLPRELGRRRRCFKQGVSVNFGGDGELPYLPLSEERRRPG